MTAVSQIKFAQSQVTFPDDTTVIEVTVPAEVTVSATTVPAAVTTIAEAQSKLNANKIFHNNFQSFNTASATVPALPETSKPLKCFVWLK